MLPFLKHVSLVSPLSARWQCRVTMRWGKSAVILVYNRFLRLDAIHILHWHTRRLTVTKTHYILDQAVVSSFRFVQIEWCTNTSQQKKWDDRQTESHVSEHQSKCQQCRSFLLVRFREAGICLGQYGQLAKILLSRPLGTHHYFIVNEFSVICA